MGFVRVSMMSLLSALSMPTGALQMSLALEQRKMDRLRAFKKMKKLGFSTKEIVEQLEKGK